MSVELVEATADEVCANCGIAALDNVKLKKCACKLLKYCSVDCQRDHRSKHKQACKKRMAEIRDVQLFKQPEISHFGECPICCLPLPIDDDKRTMMAYCSKMICNGCHFANQLREWEQGQRERCAFCREPMPKSQEEGDQIMMKRVKANDPVALSEMGKGCDDVAFEYWTKAAQLGHMDAHYNLSVLYREGERVEKNEKKEVYHLEEAAIGGHPEARRSLGCHEGNAGRHDIAMRHFIIAAKQGYDEALEEVKKGFQRGYVSKEDYATALRGHQAAVDATKSQQRDAGEEFFRWFNMHRMSLEDT